MKERTEQEYLDFLEDTVRFYSEDTSRRAVEITVRDTAVCMYITSEGKSCSIGRHLSKRTADKWQNKYCYGSVGSISMQSLHKSPKLKGYSTLFLSRVQSLHDTMDNWGENELTAEGIEAAKMIKDKILVGIYKRHTA